MSVRMTPKNTNVKGLKKFLLYLPHRGHLISAAGGGVLAIQSLESTSFLRGIAVFLVVLLLQHFYVKDDVIVESGVKEEEDSFKMKDQDTLDIAARNNKLLQSNFEHAVDYIAHTVLEKDKSSIKISPDDYIQLQALYKQTRGPAHWPRPIMPVARKKWTAHKKLSSMTPDEARRAYIKLVDKLYPRWGEELDIYKPQRRLSARDLSALAIQVCADPKFSGASAFSPTSPLTHVQAYSGNWSCDVARSGSQSLLTILICMCILSMQS
jgi:acyl-CoA-binding protein